MIPSILAFVGGVAGFILLGTVTVQGRTIGVMSGMTMSLASVGMHQAWYQIFVKRINDSTNGSQKTDQQNSKPA
jgi:phosphotransferase system  glucose/maltose/N-acetylglucosamine-specific IIC component